MHGPEITKDRIAERCYRSMTLTGQSARRGHRLRPNMLNSGDFADPVLLAYEARLAELERRLREMEA